MHITHYPGTHSNEKALVQILSVELLSKLYFAQFLEYSIHNIELRKLRMEYAQQQMHSTHVQCMCALYSAQYLKKRMKKYIPSPSSGFDYDCIIASCFQIRVRLCCVCDCMHSCVFKIIINLIMRLVGFYENIFKKGVLTNSFPKYIQSYHNIFFMFGRFFYRFLLTSVTGKFRVK